MSAALASAALAFLQPTQLRMHAWAGWRMNLGAEGLDAGAAHALEILDTCRPCTCHLQMALGWLGPTIC